MGLSAIVERTISGFCGEDVAEELSQTLDGGKTRDHRGESSTRVSGPPQPCGHDSEVGSSWGDGWDSVFAGDCSARGSAHRIDDPESAAAADWMAWLEEDPEAALESFWENYDSLPDDVKKDQALLLKVGNASQQVSTYYATLTNLQNALHDTRKAIINAIRA